MKRYFKQKYRNVSSKRPGNNNIKNVKNFESLLMIKDIRFIVMPSTVTAQRNPANPINMDLREPLKYLSFLFIHI